MVIWDVSISISFLHALSVFSLNKEKSHVVFSANYSVVLIDIYYLINSSLTLKTLSLNFLKKCKRFFFDFALFVFRLRVNFSQ